MKTFADVIMRAFKKWHDNPFIWTMVDGEYQPKTYGEVLGVSLRLAEIFRDYHIEKENFIIVAKNSWQWAAVDYSCALSNNVAVLMNAGWSDYELKNAIKLTDPKIIFVDHNTKPLIAKLAIDFPEKTVIIDLEEDLPEPINYIPKNLPRRGREKLAKILFSSGTTGRPKAIMLCEKNIFASWQTVKSRQQGLGPNDSLFAFLPFHHVYGNLVIMTDSLFVGTQIHLCSSFKALKDEMPLAHPTVICGVPLFYEKIYQAIPAPIKWLAKVTHHLPLSSSRRRKIFQPVYKAFGGKIQYFLCGGATLDPKIRQFFYDIGCGIFVCLASSESSAVLFTTPVGSDNCESVGTPAIGLEYKIHQPNAEGVGEILARGDNIFMGYYKNPEQNHLAFDQDGYFHTGDLGSIGKDGHMYMHGRCKRLILTSNGENIYPDEIEAIFERHTHVVKATVFLEGKSLNAKIDIDHLNHLTKVREYCTHTNTHLSKYNHIQNFIFAATNHEQKIK